MNRPPRKWVFSPWNPSLTVQVNDGGPRWWVFLQKAALGAVVALLTWALMRWMFPGFSLYTLFVVSAIFWPLEFAVSNIIGHYDLKPGHWATGWLLSMLWVVPVGAWVRWPLSGFLLLALVVVYPFDGEIKA